MDVRHFVIIACSHLANGCTIKCGCIGLMLFRYLSCLSAILCFGICMLVCDSLVESCATAHQASMKQNGRPMLNVHVT